MTLSDMRCSRLARRHGARLSAFFFIGAAVFVVGLAFQVALVRYAGLGADSSYVAQAILSIELSYLLNRYLTWRNRDAGFWLACWKFTAQKLIMTVVNMAAYALLVRVGVQYVAANIALTAVFTPVNYFAADLLVFVRPRRPRPRHRRRRAGRASAAVRAMAGEASGAADEMAGRTAAEVAGALVGAADGLLGRAVAGEAANQPKAPALTEVILVGDIGDPTCAAIEDITDSRLRPTLAASSLRVSSKSSCLKTSIASAPHSSTQQRRNTSTAPSGGPARRLARKWPGCGPGPGSISVSFPVPGRTRPGEFQRALPLDVPSSVPAPVPW